MSDSYPNSGMLARNDKRKTDKHPEHTGKASITCPHCNHAAEFWLSAWVKTARNSGRRYFSLAFKPKEDPGAYKPADNKARLQSQVAAATQDGYRPPDDDVPF